jgi:ParB family chromosome partitioning protein
MDSSVIDNIPIKEIRPSKFGIRSRFYEKSEQIMELENSIRLHGLLQPVLVRPDGYGFEIVAGHRRYQACKALRFRYITCRIVELNDREAFEIQLIENLQRKTMDPVEEAESFRRYIVELGWGGISELARKISKSEEYISQHLQILNLPESIKNQIINSQIRVSHALELVNLPDQVKLEFAKQIADQHLTIREVREMKKVILNEDLNGNKEEMNRNGKYKNRDKSLAIIKKTNLLLRLQLRRIDDLIEESNTIIDESEQRSELIRFLMLLRLKVHSLVDQTIGFEKNMPPG